MGSLQSRVALWWAPTGDTSLTSQVRGGWHPPSPSQHYPLQPMAKPHGRLAAQNTQQPQKSPLVEVFHKAKEFYHPTGAQQPPLPCPTSVPPHLCPNVGPTADPPHRCVLSSSPHAGRQRNGGGLSVEQLFISLCRGNLGLFMEIQMLLNNRCSSEKENFFCFGG